MSASAQSGHVNRVGKCPLSGADRVSSSFLAATLPLHPSQTPPLFCNAGRNATSSPPARLELSLGTETRLETTTSRANTDPPCGRLNGSITNSEIVHGFLRTTRSSSSAIVWISGKCS